MVYGVCLMQRTNIYLEDDDLESLRALGSHQGRAVAELVREAVAEWLDKHDVQHIDEDDWQVRLGLLLERRQQIATEAGWDTDEVERDVAASVAEVREARSASGR